MFIISAYVSAKYTVSKYGQNYEILNNNNKELIKTNNKNKLISFLNNNL